MKDFFEGQFDYIYFFYGFALFLLAFICFTLDKSKLRKFPWTLLGLFGLIHSLVEWIDMLMIIYGKNRILSIFNLFVLSGSFLCLFEFARIGFFRIKKIKISRWAYLPFLMLLPLGHKYGLNGWAAMIRYLLGFPSAYLASRMIYEFSKTEKEGKYPLKYLSILLALYAITTGLVVPQAGFFPATLINFESFYETFGIPVQVFRAIFALCAALAIWFYSSVSSEISYRLPRYVRHYVPTKWTIGLTLVVLVIAGWIFTNYFDYYARLQIIVKNVNPQSSSMEKLTRELTRLRKGVIALSKNQTIRNAISSPNPDDKTMDETNKILDHYTAKFNALNCALMNRKGSAIAATKNNKSGIKVDSFYASKPYFRKAILGDTGYHLEAGATYNEHIYYISYPVKNIADKISGVVVIEKNIPTEPLFSYRFFSILITFFVCLIVITFFMILKRRESFITFIERINARLEEVDRLKTDFISIVSHELRTPLTSIKNAASILRKGGPAKRVMDEHEENLIKIILTNVDRQTKMVNDLLDVSKIEAGAMSISAKPIDIVSLAKNVINSFKPVAELKKIDIVFLSGKDKEIVYSDSDHTMRIFNNLIDNAIKFTPDSGKITVKVENIGKEIKVTVSDTGAGIATTDKEKIFTKFCVSASTEALNKKGCGLGLTITKGLVEALKGKIWVESEPGKGSSFYFTLPTPR